MSLTFLSFLSCAGLKMGKLLDIEKLNDQQITAIKEISISDFKGVKYLKDDFSKGSFKSLSVTSTKQKVTNEDYRKVKQIIQKYR